VIIVVGLTGRAIEWAFERETHRRHYPPPQNGACDGDGRTASQKEHTATPAHVLLDAAELCANLRGIGWSWTRNRFPVPHCHPLPLHIVLLVTRFTAMDAVQYILQLLHPSANTPSGDTIFNPSLPLVPRLLLAWFSTILGGFVVYFSIEVMYATAALVGRCLLFHDAWQWPLLFNEPWRATSIVDFWTRWHQFFRRSFIVLGAAPGTRLCGRVGGVLGAFAVSALLHLPATWALGRNAGIVPVGGFFVMSGVGVLIEAAARGRVRGRAWVLGWNALWGAFMVDAWARRGIIASEFAPGHMRPGKYLVKRGLNYWGSGAQ